MSCWKSVLIGVSMGWTRRPRFLLTQLFAAMIVLAFSASAPAQTIIGTVRSQVLDPSGAVVPNARVNMTDQKTGVAVKITTSSASRYSLPSLIPGLSEVDVERGGFENFSKRDISVVANQDNAADARLELDSATRSRTDFGCLGVLRTRRISLSAHAIGRI